MMQSFDKLLPSFDTFVAFFDQNIGFKKLWYIFKAGHNDQMIILRRYKRYIIPNTIQYNLTIFEKLR